MPGPIPNRQPPTPNHQRTPGRALMVQGTASHVGKSVIVAGLCRLFRQEGLRVAPFKAQNMALNSFPTPDGREIGRAQAAQAEAAGIPPSAEMNPILLKPEGNSRSQVVVRGEVYATLEAREYHRRTEELWPVVEASLRGLMNAFDLVIIEGAGSPAEVNLAPYDIVNMRVARAADAPVLLVADIERGGVFGALVGTMALLEPEDQGRVGGFVVNKFRGDPALFLDGVTFLARRLGRPVLGVVPWIEGLGIAEEDSLGLPGSHSEPSRPSVLSSQPSVLPWPLAGSLHPDPSPIDIAVIRLPHMANFDEFQALADRPGVRVRYVERVESLGQPDLLVLPGTKTTRADLRFLRERGLDWAVIAHARAGGVTMGICGGYQMLGERIEDPDGVEGPAGGEAGLGLLPAVTRYAPEKATRQVHARVIAGAGFLAEARGRAACAYEIHMGRTDTTADPVFLVDDGDGFRRAEGAASSDGRIVGTYLHGLFQDPELGEALLAALGRARGIALPAPRPRIDPYDRLADVLRASLDVDRLRTLAGLSP